MSDSKTQIKFFECLSCGRGYSPKHMAVKNKKCVICKGELVSKLHEMEDTT